MASGIDQIVSVSLLTVSIPEPKPAYRREIRTSNPYLRYTVEVHHLKTFDKWHWMLRRIFDTQDVVIGASGDGKSAANSIREAIICLRLFRDIYRDADK